MMSTKQSFIGVLLCGRLVSVLTREGWMRGTKRSLVIVTIMLASLTPVLTARLLASDSTASQQPEKWWSKQWKPPAPTKPVLPRPAALAAKALLDKNSQQRWGGRWSEETGLAVDGFWGRTTKRYSGTPEQIAQQFLTDYRPLVTGFKLEEDRGDITFKVESFQEDRDYDVVYLHEHYRGVPVYNAGPNVHIDKQGHIIGLWGKTYPVGSLDVAPALDSAAICAALERAIAPDSVESYGHVRLSVFPSQAPRLVYDVWAVVSADRIPEPYLILLDANTGEILSAARQTLDEPKPRSHAQPSRDTMRLPDGFDVLRSAPVLPHIEGTKKGVKGPVQPSIAKAKVVVDSAPGPGDRKAPRGAPPSEDSLRELPRKF